MYYLGIDIGKNNHVASMMDGEGQVIFKAFSFPNTTDGGNALLEKFNRFASSTSSVEIGMEATGHYWLSLYSFLHEKGYMIHVVNPILTDGWRKGVEIRKRKTDGIDSVLIADLIRYGNFMETSLSDETILSLRNLCRFRSYLVDSISDLKLKTICVLDQVFPEYQSVFSDIFGQTSRELLKNFQSLDDWVNLDMKKLLGVLEQIKLKTFARKKIDQVSSLAKSSFGVSFCKDSFSFQLKLLIEQISFVDDQVKVVEKEIEALLEKMNSPITSITGIGFITGATILGEIGDISRFSSPAKLVAYAGIDASVSQSGDYHSTNNRMSKRGSPYLRRALFQAAFVASQRDPILKAFYLKKRAEGKHHYTAIGAVSRKLCYVIFAILKENRPYEVRPVSVD